MVSRLPTSKAVKNVAPRADHHQGRRDREEHHRFGQGARARQHHVEDGQKAFRFKFDKKQSPFGLAKGKSWVLLANFLSDAQLNNAIAMRTAQLVGASHANHMIPVELYINGSYRGLYNLTEQVDLASNSVVVPDESRPRSSSGTLTTATPSVTVPTSCPSTSKPPKSKTM